MPRAIVNWFMWERMGDTLAVPLSRQRWVRDGESFTAGDRTLYAVRPPVFDSPTTRGLFDSKTGVYWASDSLRRADARPRRRTSTRSTPAFWHDGMAMFHQYVSPWYALPRRPEVPADGQSHRVARRHEHRRLPHPAHRLDARRAGVPSDPHVRRGDRADRARTGSPRPDARRRSPRRVSVFS